MNSSHSRESLEEMLRAEANGRLPPYSSSPGLWSPVLGNGLGNGNGNGFGVGGVGGRNRRRIAENIEFPPCLNFKKNRKKV